MTQINRYNPAGEAETPKIVEGINTFLENIAHTDAAEIAIITVLGVQLMPCEVAVREVYANTFTLTCLEIPSADEVTLPIVGETLRELLQGWEKNYGYYMAGRE